MEDLKRLVFAFWGNALTMYEVNGSCASSIFNVRLIACKMQSLATKVARHVNEFKIGRSHVNVHEHCDPTIIP